MIDKKNCHILIIQDQETARLMELILERDGFKNVHKASSSEDALLIIEEKTPELIILYFHSFKENEPTGVDLFHQYKNIAVLKNTSFLIYEALLTQEKCQKHMEMGFSGVLVRPLGVQEFSNACTIVLNGGTYFIDCDKYW